MESCIATNEKSFINRKISMTNDNTTIMQKKTTKRNAMCEILLLIEEKLEEV